MVTIYDIAKLANVSTMTVSRVINQKKNVSKETREKVEQAIQELNYVPNTIAQSLQANRMKTLALLVTDITNPFFTQMTRGAEDEANKQGYQLLLCNTDENIAKEKSYILALLGKRIDGVMLVPSGDESLDSISSLRQAGVPFTLLDRNIRGIECSHVTGDSKEGTRQLVQHLIDQGHRRIAMIHAPLNISTSRERNEAYKATLRANGLSVDKRLIVESHYHLSKQSNTWSFLQMEPAERPTAVVAANNFIADQLLKTLADHDLTISEDIAVACFDELLLPSYIEPFLTTVSQPPYAMGQRAVECILEQIKDPEAVQQEQFKPTLHVRRSTNEWRGAPLA
ncbi:LacI family transcriptional regulator [Bacillaceae bacterium SIJ1]|uniref:LacI family DNA-binding transcriptional regulator n=1 Tax=Litoribacterium kuwaitense TaxID=1398745 RepID=UPI0013EBD0A9|nr:LacI family DNA-binding transcriptional regulator [Litoribacterium kuwaitense]NGP45445.1 LacI family transcriptional regulator [Litoribacterium kuwaitense]